VELDVTDPSSIDNLIKEIDSTTGAADVLINNAGIYSLQPWFQITPDEMQKVFAVNVHGLTLTLQAVAKYMIERQRRRSIINIASAAGRKGNPASVIYSASKSAVISITQSAALALIKHGIRVNAIAPGGVDTPMWKIVDAEYARISGQAPGSMTDAFIDSVPSKRLGKPDDFVGAALFLASDSSDYIVGQTMNIDGGLFMG